MSCGVCARSGLGDAEGQLACQLDILERRPSGPRGPRDPALELAAWPSSARPPPPGSGDTKLGVANIRPAGHCPQYPVFPLHLALPRGIGLCPQPSSLPEKPFSFSQLQAQHCHRSALPLCVGTCPLMGNNEGSRAAKASCRAIVLPAMVAACFQSAGQGSGAST